MAAPGPVAAIGIATAKVIHRTLRAAAAVFPGCASGTAMAWCPGRRPFEAEAARADALAGRALR